jgi:hypothetical protein
MNAAMTAMPRAGSRAPSRVPVAIQARASWKRRLMALTPVESIGRGEQAAVFAGIPPDEVEQDGCQFERDAVKDDGGETSEAAGRPHHLLRRRFRRKMVGAESRQLRLCRA